MKNKTMIIVVTCLVMGLTIYLMPYAGVISTDNNERESLIALLHKQKTIEGNFTDADGRNIFAPTKPYISDNTELPVAYSYLLGYNSIIYGTTGLRKRYSGVLYEDQNTGKGGTVQLTTKNSLQFLTYAELQKNNLSGSIIVLNNKTGDILACVSRKIIDYDAGNIDERYEEYSRIEGFFMPHATTDQDPPGSVYKLITTVGCVETENEDYTYYDNGEYKVDDAVIHNYGNYSYGEENLQTAFSHSTNTYFSSLAVEKIGESKIKEVSDRFLIGQDIQLDFATLKSNIEFDGSDKMLAFTSFGQGKLQITPLHLSMIGQVLGNDGVLIKPHIVLKVNNAKNKTIYKSKSEKSNVLGKSVVKQVRIIANQTAKDRFPELYEISNKLCVKTGTAQLGNQMNHAYFLAFDDEYTVLVSINNTSSSGGEYKHIVLNILKEICK